MGSRSTPEHWDFTLLPFAGIIRGLLDAVGARSVVEVGADRGEFTAELLGWAAGADARVTAVDPEPAPELVELTHGRPELALVRRPSPEALEDLDRADAVILDGDHNHYTVSEELRLLSRRFPSALILLHDVGWPHARRDTYYAPERIPEEHRQPLARDALVAPGKAGLASVGIGFPWAAEREGGPWNGVLTAVEDHLAGAPGRRLAIVPAFFGLGVLWPQDAPWAAAVAEILDPWDGSPMLERLEEVRVASIVDATRLNRQEELLRAMLNSRSFAVAERISRLRRSGAAPLSRERIRRALSE
jgi:Methyltransferase domain